MSKSYFCLLACLCSFPVQGGDSIQLKRVQHDPFQRPVIPQKSAEEIVDIEASKPAAKELWAPKLTATLRAGRNSMANVDGKIIKLGDTLDGYRLIEVDERSAVFVKNKQRTQLTIDDETNE